MKIAHLVWTLSIGGIQTMLVDIVNEQVKTQEVAIFVVNCVVDEVLVHKLDKRVLLVRCNRKPGSKNPIPIMKLNRIMHIFHPDIIHCHEDKLTELLFRNKTPLVRTIHNTHSSSKEYTKFEKLCCISHAVKDYTATQGFPDGIVVYNGIHTDDIPKRSLPFPDISELCKCVCVGRLHPMKGQNVLIEAVNILVNKRQKTGFSLDLIGDGEFKNELQALVREYGLESFIHFLGRQQREEFYPKLKDYDLFILPSVTEGFGLTLAEACAAKIPVLTCDLGGPMEVIANGRYGSVFKTGDTYSLANEIERFWVNGIDCQKVDDAYLFVKKHFDINVTSQKYIDIYNEIITKVV